MQVSSFSCFPGVVSVHRAVALATELSQLWYLAVSLGVGLLTS